MRTSFTIFVCYQPAIKKLLADKIQGAVEDFAALFEDKEQECRQLILLPILLGEQQHLCTLSESRTTLIVNQSVEVNLTCHSTSPSPTEFKWSKDGTGLSPGNINRVKDKLFSVLTIKNTSRSDSGKYKCVCTSNDGSNNSDETEIAVHVRGKSFSKKLVNFYFKNPKARNKNDYQRRCYTLYNINKPTYKESLKL